MFLCCTEVFLTGVLWTLLGTVLYTRVLCGYSLSCAWVNLQCNGSSKLWAPMYLGDLLEWSTLAVVWLRSRVWSVYIQGTPPECGPGIVDILSVTTRVRVGYHFYFTRDVSSKLFPECFSTRGIIFKKHPKWNKSDTTWEKSCGKDFILWLIFEVDLDLYDAFFFALFGGE